MRIWIIQFAARQEPAPLEKPQGRNAGASLPRLMLGGCTLLDSYSIIHGAEQLLRLAEEPDARLPPMPENVSRRN